MPTDPITPRPKITAKATTQMAKNTELLSSPANYRVGNSKLKHLGLNQHIVKAAGTGRSAASGTKVSPMGNTMSADACRSF